MTGAAGVRRLLPDPVVSEPTFGKRGDALATMALHPPLITISTVDGVLARP